VSAFGGTTHFLLLDDVVQTVGGTSLSAPLFSAALAQLVAVSQKLSGKPLGFVNPLLYQMAADTASLSSSQRAFNDITIGDNVCPQTSANVGVTNSNCYEKCQGYYTAPGWDPVTGLGTPNVAAMVNYLTAKLSNGTLPVDSSSGGSRNVGDTGTPSAAMNLSSPSMLLLAAAVAILVMLS